MANVFRTYDSIDNRILDSITNIIKCGITKNTKQGDELEFICSATSNQSVQILNMKIKGVIGIDDSLVITSVEDEEPPIDSVEN